MLEEQIFIWLTAKCALCVRVQFFVLLLLSLMWFELVQLEG